MIKYIILEVILFIPACCIKEKRVINGQLLLQRELNDIMSVEYFLHANDSTLESFYALRGEHSGALRFAISKSNQ